MHDVAVDLDALRACCLAKPGAIEEHPFGPGALVMKVRGKLFAIIMENEDPLSVSLKFEPEIVPVVRQAFEDVIPGYHLNKKHWNTVVLTASIKDSQLKEWIDDSYDLVVDKLPKKAQAELRQKPTER